MKCNECGKNMMVSFTDPTILAHFEYAIIIKLEVHGTCFHEGRTYYQNEQYIKAVQFKE